MSTYIRIVIVSIFIGAVGCSLLSGKGGEAVFAPTDIGTPEGEKTIKNIGPEGGVLSSADGRLTVTIPANAVIAATTFSVQPITNKSEGGIGTAYRLEPSGQVLNAPAQIVFHYSEQDLVGTEPQALRLAYQDEKGAWHQQNSVILDEAGTTITVSAKHFSDWAPKTTYSFGVSPNHAVLRVGETLPISATVCEHYKATLSQESKMVCRIADECSWTLEGPGQLSSGGPQMIYTAPARKGYARVTCRGRFWPDHESALGTEIRIFEQSYRASGQTADLIYGGTICSLYDPFTVYGKAGSFYYNFGFKPLTSTGTSGSVDVSGAGYSATALGRPSYTIEGIDGDHPRIAVSGAVTGYSPAGTITGSGTIYIDLAPFESEECLGDVPPKAPSFWSPSHPDLRGRKYKSM